MTLNSVSFAFHGFGIPSVDISKTRVYDQFHSHQKPAFTFQGGIYP